MTIYTLGYTRKSLRRCIELLSEARVEIMIDVRLRNSGQLSGWTKREDIEFILNTFGIAYSHRLDAAPTPELLDRYREDHDWERYEDDYRRLLAERAVLDSLRADFAGFERVCLLCSEDSPRKCHRRLLAEEISATWPDSSVVHLL